MSNELQKISGIGSELVASAVTAPLTGVVGPLATVFGKRYTEKEREKVNKKVLSNLIPGVAPFRLGRRIKTALAGTAQEKEIKKKASDIYQEAFNDELKKVAGFSNKELDEFTSATRQWEDKTETAQRAAPKRHVFAPSIGAAAGAALGVGAAALSKKPFKFVGGLGGLMGGAAIGNRLIKNTPYGKQVSKIDKEFSAAGRAISKKMRLRTAKEKYVKKIGKIEKTYA